MSLSRAEKNVVLKLLQDEYFPEILNAISSSRSKKEKIEGTEDVLEQSIIFRDFYHYMSGLEKIEKINNKKEEIQKIISKYVHRVITPLELSNHFVDNFIKKATSTWGTVTLKKLIAMIIYSETFPTVNLEDYIPDSEDESLRNAVYAIDLLSHAKISPLHPLYQEVQNCSAVSISVKLQPSTKPEAKKTLIHSSEQKFTHFKQPASKTSGTFSHEEIQGYHLELSRMTRKTCNILFLAIASKKSKESIIKILQEDKAILKSIDTHGNNALHLAAFFCRDDLISLFCKKIDINSRNNFGLMPVSLAILSKENSTKTLETLEANGCDFNATVTVNTTVLPFSR